uniref:Phytocyanin domain-containing protein n=1 Tax=Cannabis sativa TaxID=3483 RepID=A0A803Q7K3_CANSA
MAKYQGRAFQLWGLAICLSLSLIPKSFATNFTIGSAAGWSVSNAQSYNQWAETNRFQIGDSIVMADRSSNKTSASPPPSGSADTNPSPAPEAQQSPSPPAPSEINPTPAPASDHTPPPPNSASSLAHITFLGYFGAFAASSLILA